MEIVTPNSSGRFVDVLDSAFAHVLLSGLQRDIEGTALQNVVRPKSLLYGRIRSFLTHLLLSSRVYIVFMDYMYYKCMHAYARMSVCMYFFCMYVCMYVCMY